MLRQVGPRASRALTNSSGLPSVGGGSGDGLAACRSSPVNTPALRYFSRKRRICAVRARPLLASGMARSWLGAAKGRRCPQPSGGAVKATSSSSRHHAAMHGTLYTIGNSTRAWEEFTKLLDEKDRKRTRLTYSHQ